LLFRFYLSNTFSVSMKISFISLLGFSSIAKLGRKLNILVCSFVSLLCVRFIILFCVFVLLSNTLVCLCADCILMVSLLILICKYRYLFSMTLLNLSSVCYRFCGLVVTVSGLRYRGPVFDPLRYQIFRVVVRLERGPLSLVILVRSIKELLEWKN